MRPAQSKFPWRTTIIVLGGVLFICFTVSVDKYGWIQNETGLHRHEIRIDFPSWSNDRIILMSKNSFQDSPSSIFLKKNKAGPDRMGGSWALGFHDAMNPFNMVYRQIWGYSPPYPMRAPDKMLDDYFSTKNGDVAFIAILMKSLNGRPVDEKARSTLDNDFLRWVKAKYHLPDDESAKGFVSTAREMEQEELEKGDR